MSNSYTIKGPSLGVCWTLFIVFLVLKLTHVIDWSWWWVSAPLWIPFAGMTAMFMVFGFICALFHALSRRR